MVTNHSNQPFSGRQWAVVLFFHAVAALGQGTDGGRFVVDQAVASVEGKVITASQLEFEARVLIINGGGVEAATAPLDFEVLSKSLNAVIDQRLATLEADKIDAYAVEPSELEKSVSAFRARFMTDPQFRQFLENHEADVADLAQVLRRMMRAQRALEGRLRLKAQVSENEARQYQLQHAEMKDVPLEGVRQRLFSQRFQALVRDDLTQARKQADVRLLGPYAPRGDRR